MGSVTTAKGAEAVNLDKLQLQRRLDEFIQQSVAGSSLSGTSLIISLFGDMVSHRGGEIWLGSLSQLLAGLGFSDRFVRTALFRLTKEGWLEVNRLGRRSFYRLTATGYRQFCRAESRIYLSELPQWQGKWHLLLLGHLAKEQRNRLRKELVWQGFGQISPYLMALPDLLPLDIANLLQDLSGSSALYFHGDMLTPTSVKELTPLVTDSWPIEQLAVAYTEFIDRFRPISQLLMACSIDEVTQERCFYINLLLIHAYRRIILKDPLLPGELLPLHWQGQSARMLCTHLYKRLAPAAECFIGRYAETSIGSLPEADSLYYQRFGGL